MTLWWLWNVQMHPNRRPNQTVHKMKDLTYIPFSILGMHELYNQRYYHFLRRHRIIPQQNVPSSWKTKKPLGQKILGFPSLCLQRLTVSRLFSEICVEIICQVLIFIYIHPVQSPAIEAAWLPAEETSIQNGCVQIMVIWWNYKSVFSHRAI